MTGYQGRGRAIASHRLVQGEEHPLEALFTAGHAVLAAALLGSRIPRERLRCSHRLSPRADLSFRPSRATGFLLQKLESEPAPRSWLVAGQGDEPRARRLGRRRADQTNPSLLCIAWDPAPGSLCGPGMEIIDLHPAGRGSRRGTSTLWVRWEVSAPSSL